MASACARCVSPPHRTGTEAHGGRPPFQRRAPRVLSAWCVGVRVAVCASRCVRAGACCLVRVAWQADAVKAGGLNEWLACALLAERKGVPMCPHAGGVGLCNMAAHLSCIDYACINPAMPLAARTTEYIDFLQEHFVHPVTLLRGGRYAVPTCAGWGLDMKPASLDMYEWPGGVYWSSRPEHFDAAGTPW
jgi:hypothetical protein